MAKKKKRGKKMPAWKRRRIQQLRRRMMIGGFAVGLLLIFIIVFSVVKHNVNKKNTATREAVLSTAGTVEADASSTENPTTESIADSGAETQTENTAALTETPMEETQETEETQTIEAEPLSETALQEDSSDSGESSQVNTSNLYNPAADRIPDRSNFAAQPGVPCGQDHNNGEKVVYLTLDDGPSYLTEQFLDVLDRYGVKCTFFVTGQDPDYYYLIKEAYDRGHTIGLHTYSHNYEYIYSSVDNYFDDLYKIAAVVEEQIGYVPCFIRFPGGADNWISTEYCEGIMTVLSQEVQNRGFQYFDWNISSGDGSEGVAVETLVANATNNYDWPNLVLLSHDGAYKETTLEALPQIIEYYLSQGYEFRALDRDTFYSHAAVRN